MSLHLRIPPPLLLLLLLLSPLVRAQVVNDPSRDDNARQVRISAAQFQANRPPATHANNNDRFDFGRWATYSKGLPHDALGEPDPIQYDALVTALITGDPAALEAVLLGGERQLVNPQAGFAYVLEGADPQAFTMRPAPDFDSDEVAGEMVELYWMSTLRDQRFDTYSAPGEGITAAVNNLNNLRLYRGARASSGLVTPATLFRADTPGAIQGPFISQFLVKTVPFGGGPLTTETDTPSPAGGDGGGEPGGGGEGNTLPPGVEPTAHQPFEQRIWTRFPGDDRVTAYSEWLAIQNGAPPVDPVDTLQDFDDTRRYIRNGRDLAEWVHFDYPVQASLNAALIMARQGDFLPNGRYDSDPKSSPRAFDVNNPYRDYQNQEPFVTHGNSDVQSVTTLVTNTVLRGQWFQKWQIHRRLRPEEYGGRVHNTLTGARVYPVPQELLSSPVLPIVFAGNAQRNPGTVGTYLLSQAFPEGSPVHPAYGSGHSTYIGAGVTVLKAFYSDFPVINPQVPDSTGTALVPYSGTLMMFDELDKLASNVGVARLFAGVHYRSDHDHAVRLGELYALTTLQDWARLYPEDGFQGFHVRTLGGNVLVVRATSPSLPNAVSAVNSFTLVDAGSNTDIGPLHNGDVLDLSNLAAQGHTQLSVRANTYLPGGGSVRFTYDGVNQPVDNTDPYTLAGESAPLDYNPFNFTTGTHVLRATPFSAANAGGVGGVPLTVRFTVQP